MNAKDAIRDNNCFCIANTPKKPSQQRLYIVCLCVCVGDCFSHSPKNEIFFLTCAQAYYHTNKRSFNSYPQMHSFSTHMVHRFKINAVKIM